MKNLPINSTVKLMIFFLTTPTVGSAQDITTVKGADADISENLDLEAVASLFGDSKDLEDFEYKLNDPETPISNLDLNEDGNVDYLRIVEVTEDGTHLIAIQAVIGEDIFQDVATIEVEREDKGKTHVQVVGDVYLYGPAYIIEPVYVYQPVIFSFFWRPSYKPYHSHYYWGYYPRHYHFWKPFHATRYRKHVHRYVNTRHTYHRTHVRYSSRAVYLQTRSRRNDYGNKHPNRSYTARVTRVHSANGTTASKAGVKRANGTTRKVAAVERSDGSKKTVAVKKGADGSGRVIAVNKKADGSRTVRTTTRSAHSKNQARKRTVKTKKRSGKSKKRS